MLKSWEGWHRHSAYLFPRYAVAIRVIRSAIELGWGTVAVYMENDESHASFADEAVKLSGPTDFMNVDIVVQIAVKYVF